MLRGCQSAKLEASNVLSIVRTRGSLSSSDVRAENSKHLFVNQGLAELPLCKTYLCTYIYTIVISKNLASDYDDCCES